METSTSPADSDTAAQTDDLRRLVPRNPAWLRGVIVVACCAALAAAWFVPPWLNPHLVDGFSSGSSAAGSTAMPNTPFVLTQVGVPAGQSPVTILGMNDVAGARAQAVWVTHSTEAGDAVLAAWNSVSPQICSDSGECTQPPGTYLPPDAPSMMAALQAADPGIGAAQVPQRLAGGDQLWVLWEITDCGAAYSTEGSWGTDPLLRARLRGPLGNTVVQKGSWLLGPYDFGVDWLQDAHSCPA